MMKLLTEATVNPLSVTATWLRSAPAGTVGVVIVGGSVGVVVGRAVEETLVIVVDDGDRAEEVGMALVIEVVGIGSAMHSPCMFS